MLNLKCKLPVCQKNKWTASCVLGHNISHQNDQKQPPQGTHMLIQYIKWYFSLAHKAWDYKMKTFLESDYRCLIKDMNN